jgi:hypothetical protein
MKRPGTLGARCVEGANEAMQIRLKETSHATQAKYGRTR